MDDGNGKFVMADALEELRRKEANRDGFELKDCLVESQETAEEQYVEFNEDGIFREGETVTIKGSSFRIQSINAKGKMVLKLLKKGVDTSALKTYNESPYRGKAGDYFDKCGG